MSSRLSNDGTWCVGCCQRRNDGTSFHCFPMKDENRLQKWIAALRRDRFKPTVHTRICARHFLKSDYHPYSKYLRKTAVPSVFDLLDDDDGFCLLKRKHPTSGFSRENVTPSSNLVECHPSNKLKRSMVGENTAETSLPHAELNHLKDNLNRREGHVWQV